ncbi:hypothetical protein MUN74_06245 [Agromyces endophyticus]|uniref:hypothetical protein n=1 Tax=Agromyces sp. H17E-10 TaxID=2932244 RepID=UPI001FD1C193|nr:hypothetical protein [Agromyces sp. H17E-10]UOQ90511.1 hypothetical protein MUN74_06245 [Agromyces sp. H17E-10]
MSAITTPNDDSALRPERPAARRTADGGVWPKIWPAALGVLVAAGTAYGLTDARQVAPVVAASGLVYLAAAATGRRWAAWVAFGATFIVIGLAKFTELDATFAMLVLAAALFVVGLVGRPTRPWWALPLQSVAMLVLGVVAVVATLADATVGGLIVAVALLAHAGWDVYHHRTGRVVDRSLAEFCAVLDVLVAVVVAFVALSA